jgi:hypothetical protein
MAIWCASLDWLEPCRTFHRRHHSPDPNPSRPNQPSGWLPVEPIGPPLTEIESPIDRGDAHGRGNAGLDGRAGVTVLTGTFQGLIVFRAPVLFGIPIGLVEGSFALNDQAGHPTGVTLPFSGTFRLPVASRRP